jgi:hypothetical protein
MDDSLPDPLAFEPVPSASSRHDGWTPARQREFVRQLARIGSVSAAARGVGMSAKSAYALRKRARAESGFAAAWDEAVAAGSANAYYTAVERALEGVEIPYFFRGIQRGTRRVYNDRLLIAALRASGWMKGKEPL